MSRNFVVLWVTAIGLALAAAVPAGATVRTAAYTWTPASGPVAGYQVFVSVDGRAEHFYSYAYQPSAVIQVESTASLVVRVAAFDAPGHVGARSDPSVPLRLCPGDFDGDEVIEITDYNTGRSCLNKQPVGVCAGADMNGDGIVSLQDAAAIKVGADACPPPATRCGGDMNGDGWISLVDVTPVKSCLGLMAQGNCTYADLTGDGFVGIGDVNLVLQWVGTQACSH